MFDQKNISLIQSGIPNQIILYFSISDILSMDYSEFCSKMLYFTTAFSIFVFF